MSEETIITFDGKDYKGKLDMQNAKKYIETLKKITSV